MTKKSVLHKLRNKEKRESRIKETQNFILSKTYGSLMNNRKWYRIFEWIELNKIRFKLKTLLSPEFRNVDQIFELESNSVLIEDSGNFIEYLELEEIILEKRSEIKSLLEKLNVEFIEELNSIRILGYRI